jgi:hypothetical protein
MGLFRPDPDPELQRLKKRGLSYAAISRETGLSYNLVWTRLNPRPVLVCDDCGRKCGQLRGGLAPGLLVCRTCERGRT